MDFPILIYYVLHVFSCELWTRTDVKWNYKMYVTLDQVNYLGYMKKSKITSYILFIGYQIQDQWQTSSTENTPK